VTAPDSFDYDDAAYVLGSLAPDERAAFEEHLSTCIACMARVREIEEIPALLSGIVADDLRGANEPLPDTLLRGLLRKAGAQQRRQRRVITSLASIAAACLIALGVAVWPSSAPSKPTTAAWRPFVAVVAQSPVRATATLTAKAWGTAIELRCQYLSSENDRAFSYRLVITDRRGHHHLGGDWTLPPGRDIRFPTGTSVPLAQIAKIEITLPSGTPILRLSV
jgi:hypothetical protein